MLCFGEPGKALGELSTGLDPRRVLAGSMHVKAKFAQLTYLRFSRSSCIFY